MSYILKAQKTSSSSYIYLASKYKPYYTLSQASELPNSSPTSQFTNQMDRNAIHQETEYSKVVSLVQDLIEPNSNSWSYMHILEIYR